ncbi:putative bifunctional diguanylate cyclase/phosphodiesterase [Novosphingobium panipatense]|uniref:Diguanylate cyclase/phosphodiesterase n=1 Tax=Novosphingobium panipatense TaxID=428991 RepID=A0ABY1PZH1_9SPHN|nr:diguanylate cyclase/phosphodiesterase [Novosphingobium panipatense]
MQATLLNWSGLHRRRSWRGRKPDSATLVIAGAAAILFLALTSQIAPALVRLAAGQTKAFDTLVVNAFLLNLLFLVLGWRRFRGLRQEISERTASEREARLLAETDPLTGFHNRRSFNLNADAMIRDIIQTGDAVGVLMIDLDNFKQVNDYNGHSAGDRLLRECARRILADLPAEAIAGRIGGDEFAIALPFDPDHPEAVDELASTIARAVAESSCINSVTVEVTASIGLAKATSATTSAQALLEMADVAMYHAKRQGRNQFTWFEPSMAHEMRFRADLEAGIRQGIPRGEFVPFYDQQIDIRTGELVGFAVLFRWDSPQFGITAADVFLPVAEDIGLIAELCRSVIGQALEDAKGWDSGLTLSIRLLPTQLRDPGFAGKLLHMLEQAQFPAHRLEVEVPDALLHSTPGLVHALAIGLRQKGVRISLDDFGTSYSAIDQLDKIPFDRIKIDRSLVSKLLEQKDSAAIVQAVAALGGRRRARGN